MIERTYALGDLMEAIGALQQIEAISRGLAPQVLPATRRGNTDKTNRERKSK